MLSFVDAASGRVEVVRHWPAAPADVDVFPFVPYAWMGCPGPGAIMVLVTAPGWTDGSTISPGDDRIIHAITGRLTAAIRAAGDGRLDVSEIHDIAAGVRTPGNQVLEAIKTLLPLIADLGTYERRGYAVFAFIRWLGWRCGVVLRAVPEGYGIPFVR